MKLALKPLAVDGKKAVRLHTALSAVSYDKRKEQLTPATSSRSLKVTVSKTSGKGKLLALKKKKQHLRRIYNRQMPVLACSNCSMSAQCPKFKAGYECAFLPFLTAHEITDEADLVFYMKELLKQGIQRAQKLLIFENLSGQRPDIETSESLAHLFSQMKSLMETIQERETTSVEVGGEQTSIVSSVFGSLDGLLGRTKKAQSQRIEVPLQSEVEGLDKSKSDNPLVKELMLADAEVLAPEPARKTTIDTPKTSGNVQSTKAVESVTL